MSVRRCKLRNLDAPQKLLVGVIVGTVLGGYAAALLNVFAQHSEADGKASVHLDEFMGVYKREGLGSLVSKIQESLGMEDVVRHYHGSGGGTLLQAALNTSMKTMILDKMAQAEGRTPDVGKRAEQLRMMLIKWSTLPEDVRKSSYEEGAPVDDDGLPLFDPQKLANADKVTVVKDTFQEYCVGCHSPSGKARQFLLNDYPALNKYCVIDEGVSLKALALTTHVHLLGFSVLFAMTGFLFSVTDFPWALRLVFVPFTLAVQLVEIACWWLSKVDVFYAKMIFYLGPLVGLGLFVQAAGILFDLVFRRCERLE